MKTKKAIQKLKKEITIELPNKDQSIMEIMESVMEVNETGIIREMEKELTEKQEHKLQDIIKRLNRDEPLEYITGYSHFYGHRFKVNSHTLIPRIETEILVAITMEKIYEKIYAEEKEDISVIDVGTGTGCIVISLALAAKAPIDFYCTDVNSQTLKITRKNIKAYKIDNQITVQKSDLLDSVDTDKKFDIIVANLPYIPDDKLCDLPSSVKDYEPTQALNGGSQKGLAIIENLLKQAKDRLNNNGYILLEARPEIMPELKNISDDIYSQSTFTTQPDMYKKERFAIIQKA
jgi:release factor glutamine methyltransferase